MVLKSNISSDCHQYQFITTVNYTVVEQCSVPRLAQMSLRFLLLITTVCRHPWDLCPTARHPLQQAPLCFSLQCLAQGTDNQAPDLWCSYPLPSACLRQLPTELWMGKLRGQSWACQWWIQPCRLLSLSIPSALGWRGTGGDAGTQDFLPTREDGHIFHRRTTSRQPASVSSPSCRFGLFHPSTLRVLQPAEQAPVLYG